MKKGSLLGNVVVLTCGALLKMCIRDRVCME